MKVCGHETRPHASPRARAGREQRPRLPVRTDSGGATTEARLAEPRNRTNPWRDAATARVVPRRFGARAAAARRRELARRTKEDLGGDQSPGKDRAIRHRKRRGVATDSSAEQGLEVGHSAVGLAGAAFRKRTSASAQSHRAQLRSVARATSQSVRKRASGLTVGAGAEVAPGRSLGTAHDPGTELASVHHGKWGSPDSRLPATFGWWRARTAALEPAIAGTRHRGSVGLRCGALGRATPVARRVPR